jgi:hypothetical protein
VLRSEGVDQESEPEESDETAEYEGNELESHPRAEAGDATQRAGFGPQARGCALS